VSEKVSQIFCECHVTVQSLPGITLWDSFITALHWMQGGLFTRKPSVSPSVKRVDCDKREERSVQIFLHRTKDHFA